MVINNYAQLEPIVGMVKIWSCLSWCVTEKKLADFKLSKAWRVLSTNEDKNGLTFISSSEHFTRPVVGVQFHPEKNSYEWSVKQVPDSN